MSAGRIKWGSCQHDCVIYSMMDGEKQEASDRSAYIAAWCEYTKRRKFLFVSFLGFVPVLWAVAWVVGFALTALGFSPQTFIKLFIYCWGAFCLWSLWRWMFWPCPRCGNTFAITLRGIGRSFAPRCVHCGLTKAELKATARHQPIA